MKKMFIIAAVAAAGIMASTVAVSAAGISLEDAQKKALEAVNLKAEQVIFKPAETDTDDSRQIYEIDFFVPGEIKYEFDIDVETGMICEQDIDLWEADDDFEYAELIKAAGMKTDSAASGTETVEGEISELQARMIALVDAGFKADEVSFTKCKKDQDDGVWQYEIELRLADGTEYEYEIKAADGTILNKDIDKD